MHFGPPDRVRFHISGFIGPDREARLVGMHAAAQGDAGPDDGARHHERVGDGLGDDRRAVILEA